MTTTHILGFPRIGSKREFKKAAEAYWHGEIDQATFLEKCSLLRQQNWQLQADLGLDLITVGDFSYYDHVLDTSALLGVIPPRFRQQPGQQAVLEQTVSGPVSLDTLFTMARGQAPGLSATQTQPIAASAMTKWFNTNYHYIVPEFTSEQEFSVSSDSLFDAIDEALSFNYRVKPVLIGPLSYLWLGQAKTGDFDKLSLLPKLCAVYAQIFARIAAKSIEYIQIDEPILALDLDSSWQQAIVTAYNQLDFHGLKPIVTTYFAGLDTNFKLVDQLPVAGWHFDICSDPTQLSHIINHYPLDKILSLGVVNGRNVWKNDLHHSLSQLAAAQAKFKHNLWVASSCSLLHCPVDLEQELDLNAEIKNWLAFAKQKVTEIVLIARGLDYGPDSITAELATNQQALASRQHSPLIHNPQVANRVAAIANYASHRRSPFAKRRAIQKQSLALPELPTTTIGSFPQTAAVRKLRQDLKSGRISSEEYELNIQHQIQLAITKQEELGLDVLVHGEAERNDMVEYFAELLDGITFTHNGWVQSYGSRCVKPPLIYGDISRPQPMTVNYARYAQSLTLKPVKGMLTGPVTILAWSFARDDKQPQEIATQIALSLRDEVRDLEQAGIKIIQIDEPALREALPLKRKDWPAYLDWAVAAFKLASSGVSDTTQIHTHMCYSAFNDIIQAIASLDADVITIEASRSDLELLKAFEEFAYPNLIGPGVYDIHSPLIPDTQQIVDRIQKILAYIPKSKLWINPDCGLKTRTWPEVEAALSNMVAAAKTLRASANLHQG